MTIALRRRMSIGLLAAASVPSLPSYPERAPWRGSDGCTAAATPE